MIKFVTTLLSSVGSLLLNGFVLATLWLWFVVPVFETAPIINVMQAIGIVLVAGYLTKQLTPTDLDASATVEDHTFKVHLIAWCKPAMFLVFGYIIHLFY